MEDWRVASHAWPLDSAVVNVRAEAVCRSQSVFSVDLTFLSPPGLGRVRRKERFDEDLEAARGVKVGLGEERSSRAWADLVIRGFARVREREEERERIDGELDCDRDAIYEVKDALLRASRSSVEGRGNCGVSGARERCWRLG